VKANILEEVICDRECMIYTGFLHSMLLCNWLKKKVFQRIQRVVVQNFSQLWNFWLGIQTFELELGQVQIDNDAYHVSCIGVKTYHTQNSILVIAS